MNPVATKVCTKCGEEKPIDDFHRQRHGKHGRMSICRPCNRERARVGMRRWRTENPEEEKARAERWRKANPEKKQAQRDRWLNANKEKARRLATIGMAKRRAENPERFRKQAREWRKKNPHRVKAYSEARRAREASAPGGGITGKQWRDIVSGFGGICAYCGDSGRLEMDHIVPLSLGGAHDPDNVIPACGACNKSKGSTQLLHWLVKRATRRSTVGAV